ncbi:MAG: response regulator [Rhodospirillales bacterium]|nr:response regulator [Rhodospirillales bacterium]
MRESLAKRPDGQAVLVVDDEPTVRMLVVETLEEYGYAIFEAEDAASALDILKAPGRIDLMVTDITLPGQNGCDLAKEAKRLRPELKVLFMTGYAQNLDTHVSTKPAGADIIVKPFSLEALAKKVRAVIDN